MKRSFRSLFVLILISAFLLSACDALIGQPQPMPTEVIDQPSPDDNQVTAEVEPTPVDEGLSEDEEMWLGVYEPTPITSITEDELKQFSEAELAAYVENTVQELIAAAEEAINYINQAAPDNEITQSERDNLYYYCSETIISMKQAETQVGVYHELYGADGANAVRMEKLYNLFQGEVQDSFSAMADLVTMVEEHVEFSDQTPADLTSGARTAAQVLAKLR